MSTAARRPGKIIVMFALLLTTLLGMLGLVIDSGLMMASHRATQSVADSAALAAAMELMRGESADAARAAAVAFVQTHNGMTDATPDVRIPPTTGPHAGNQRYAEVVLTRPHGTILVQMIGPSQNQQVQARAVAGYEAVASGEGAIVLDPDARPGLAISGGATLLVNGAVVVNSRGAGLDQYGQWVDWGAQQYALTSSNNSKVYARYIQVRGGVDVVGNYRDYDDYSRQTPIEPCPLFARAPIGPDPLRDLPTPRQANVSSITDWTRQPDVAVSNGETRTLDPGVYGDIQINQGATVVFNPGVYVLSPTGPNQGLRANGSCTITGNGVMFYLTGSNYLDNQPGATDATDDAQSALDGPLPPTSGSFPASTDPNPNQVIFATMTLNATNASVKLTGLNDETSAFNGMLFFQRRRNTETAAIQGKAGVEVDLNGTIYAKWANFQLAGEGRYDAQFVVGSMSIAGQAVVSINSTGKSFGHANQVFLVE
ncbi:MAG TPA: pilus assembly protein TadG-related protein [Fimbriiglobus sp.]|nr:pilus assembly protein TadG-related protein [Fimbriiglobus sp.]